MAPKGEASIWQPRFAVNLSANTKQVEESKVALAGQSEFLLESFTYAKNTGSLTVYKNGALINKDIDWREVTPVSGDDNEADTFILTTEFLATNPTVGGDVFTAVGLTEITGTLYTSAESIISDTPPDPLVYTKATRWWDCRTGKSYILTSNSTGYKQWVEERSPIDPPNYQVKTYSTNLTELTVNGTYHSNLVEFTTDADIFVTVGKALDTEGQFVGAIVFIQNIGFGQCTILPDVANGVEVSTNSSYKLEGPNSTVALIAKSENKWVLVGNLEVV